VSKQLIVILNVAIVTAALALFGVDGTYGFIIAAFLLLSLLLTFKALRGRPTSQPTRS
jgi:hypothetical protein